MLHVVLAAWPYRPSFFTTTFALLHVVAVSIGHVHKQGLLEDFLLQLCGLTDVALERLSLDLFDSLHVELVAIRVFAIGTQRYSDIV